MDNNQTNNPDNMVEIIEDKAECQADIIPQNNSDKKAGSSIDNQTLALVSLPVSIISGFAGIIIAIIALRRIKKSDDKSGKDLAIASIILGTITTINLLIGTLISLTPVILFIMAIYESSH